MMDASVVETPAGAGIPLIRIRWEIRPDAGGGRRWLTIDVHADHLERPGRDLAVSLLDRFSREADARGPLLDRMDALEPELAAAIRSAEMHVLGRVPLRDASDHAVALGMALWRVHVHLDEAEPAPPASSNLN